MNTTKKQYNFRQKARATKLMLHILNRSNELSRLISWAEDTHLKRRVRWAMEVRQNYVNEQRDIQGKMLTIRSSFPRQYWVALSLYGISSLLSTKPHYSKGSGKSRRRKKKNRRRKRK